MLETMHQSGLTNRQRLFVLEYLKDLNATKAAERIGCAKNSAKVTGCRLLTNANVRAAVRRAMEERASRLEITADRVLQEIARIAFSDIRDVMSWSESSVTLQSSDAIPLNAARAVQEITHRTMTTEDGVELTTSKVKMYDKQRGLEMLARHLDLHGHLRTQNEPQTIDVTPAHAVSSPAVLSFEDFCERAGYPRPYPKQCEMREFGIESEGARMILGARGYGKTEYVAILGVAYRLYLDSSFRCLLITKSRERNAAILKEIHAACDKVAMRFEINNSTAIRIEGIIGKDHSVSAATIGSVTLRGRHPDLVIMDDPVTPEDTSEATRSKVKKIYDEVSKLTKNVLIIGQPVHKFDLYQTLRPQLNKMEVAYGSIPELDADLEAQRLAGVDEASIQASYFLKIVSEGRIPFATINYIEKFPIGDAAVAFVDPAFGGEDWTALTILKAYGQGVAAFGFCWHVSWEHTLEDTAKFFKKFNVKRMAFETNKTGDQPLSFLREAFPGVGVIGRFSNSNKHSRIMAAGTFAHMIHLSRESNSEYIKQVTQYEFGSKHDDGPDSLASCLGWLGLIRGKA